MAYRGKAGVHQSPVVSARHIGFGLASARQASSSSGCCRPHGQPRRSPREKERKKKREKKRERERAWPRSAASNPENVSIYLSTRSRRINGSAAGNFSRYVCRRWDFSSQDGWPGPGASASFACPGRDGRLEHSGSRLFEERVRIAA